MLFLISQVSHFMPDRHICLHVYIQITVISNFSEAVIEVEEEAGEEGMATEEVTMVTVTMEGESWVKVLTDQTTGTLMTTGVILATDVTDIIPMVIENTGVKVIIRVEVITNGNMIQTDEKKMTTLMMFSPWIFTNVLHCNRKTLV